MLSKHQFDEVADIMVSENESVGYGKMMSSPAIVYNQKVFAFLYGNSMVFKLGKDYNFNEIKITQHNIFNPFKNKAPMSNWYVIGSDNAEKWLELAEIAFRKIKT